MISSIIVNGAMAARKISAYLVMVAYGCSKLQCSKYVTKMAPIVGTLPVVEATYTRSSQLSESLAMDDYETLVGQLRSKADAVGAL